MKHLLVIANLHHASPRIPALLAPLAELGWQATVVTPPLGEDAESVLGLPVGFSEHVEIVVAPYRGDIFWFWRKVLRALGFSSQSSYTEQIKERVGKGGGGRSLVDRLMRAYQAVFAIPDTEWPWHRSACKTAQALLATRHFDAILSSSPFPTVHRVAARLKKKHPIQWIADFRDPWSQSHNYPLPKFRLQIDRWMEVRTLSNADLITTVSTGFAEKLVQLHGKKVVVIRNGYQPMPDSAPIALPERLTISYTGTIYAGKQDPVKILVALRHLIDAGLIASEHIALNFYGRYDSALQQAIAGHDLEEVATQQGRLPRVEIRRRQRASHLLLLLQWEDTDEQGIFPLKFYEYLDAGRPILATGGARVGEISDILDETGTGSIAVTVPEIEQALLRAYETYLTRGALDYQGNSEAIARYSYSGCARQLAASLEKIGQPGRPQQGAFMSTPFDDQFSLNRDYYLRQLDFLNWFRYYHLVKDVLRLGAEDVLEIGTGSGMVRNCLKPLVRDYRVLDINPNLAPDVLADVRVPQPELVGRFDCVIAADVLEHLPFTDLAVAGANLFAYLRPGGHALITIPHRQSNFLFMSPTQVPHVFTVPTGFLSFGAFYRRFIKRKIWIDPNHCWEIGDGNVRVKDVEAVLRTLGFTVEKFDKLLYVDYWVLSKPRDA